MFPFQKRLPWALIGIVLVVLAGGFLPAPASPRALSAGPGLADFLKQGGIWRSDFQGQPICMVRLNPLVKEVEGGLSLAPDFSTDDNGEVSAVDDPATLKMMVPLVEPKIEGAKLIFKMVDDPEHPDTWEMVATGPDSATLQLIETWNSDLQEQQTREQIAKWQKPFRLKQAWKGNAL